MKEYKDYQSKLTDVERQENEGSDAAEQHVPAAFLLVGAFISAAATYYLNEAGMKNSPLYAMTIGAERAAFLVTAILEGSFLALTLIGHKILKSKPQRSTGKLGTLIVKAILSINILVAFVMLAGYQTKIMPMVEMYAQWGCPFTVVGAIWFWAHIVINRRKTIIRNQMLDDAAETERLWAEQHKTDQKRYRDTYQSISASPEMQEMREQIAVTQAIEQIARESQITFQEAEEIYYRIQGRKQRQLGTPGYQSSNWRSQQRP